MNGGASPQRHRDAEKKQRIHISVPLCLCAFFRRQIGSVGFVLICSWLLLLSQPSLATPPLYPGMGGGHRDDVAPMHHRMAEGEGRLLAPGDWGIGNRVATIGEVKVIALMAEFADVKFTQNRAYFQGMMAELAEYYRKNSYGKLNIIYTLAGTYTIGTMSIYGDNDDGDALIRDVVAKADNNVDFKNYAALIVIHAGQGQESTGLKVSPTFHSQFFYKAYSGNPAVIVKADGINIYGASIVPEHEGSNASPFGIFCHEFGHQLGLPDLYDTGDGYSGGMDEWSLMDTGAWNGSPQGSLPSYFDAWCKTKLDWITPQTVTTTLIHQPIPQAETNPVAYKLWNNTMGTKEYFLVENRQGAQGESLRGKGLFIYHIDENQPDNNDQSHYMVALEQADGQHDLENRRNSDAGDPYPGSTVNKYFDDWSVPNSLTYSGVHTYIAVKNISDSTGTMTADLSVVSSFISLSSPSNNATLTTNTPTFMWAAVEGVGTYTLIVETRTFTVVGTTSYRLSTPLVEDAKYQWQVMATTTSGPIASDIWHFWIDAVNSPPSAFALLSPCNGQTISQQTPTFRWQVSTDPDPLDEVRYILQYSKLGTTSIIKSGTLATNSYTPAQNMGEGTYSWKVKAMDKSGNITWSGTATFAISMITEEGGTVTGQDGTTTVIFPEGAASGMVSVDIMMPPEIEEKTQQVINAATNVSIATSSIRQVEVTNGQAAFAKPVTIQLPCSGTTTKMAIYRLTPDGRWEMLPGSIVDPASQTIRAQVYFFSVFGVGPAASYIPPASIISSVTNWPNPFVSGRESTTIYYVLKQAADVSISIYNPIGELVWQQEISANNNGARQGVNEIPWDGKNSEDEMVSQGIYFCVIEAGSSQEIRKIGVR